jgi:hypothetical protein
MPSGTASTEARHRIERFELLGPVSQPYHNLHSRDSRTTRDIRH